MGGVEGVWVQSELLERVTAVRLVVGGGEVVSTVVDVVREGRLFGQGRVGFWWWWMEGLASGSVCASGGRGRLARRNETP